MGIIPRAALGFMLFMTLGSLIVGMLSAGVHPGYFLIGLFIPLMMGARR